MKYLLIYEDLSMSYTDTLTDEHYQECELGILSIINFNHPVPLEYYNGEWHELDKFTPHNRD